MAAVTMVIAVGWALTGFFLSAATSGALGLERLPVGNQVNVYVFTLLVLVFIPLIVTGPRWTTVGTAVVGLLNLALVGIYGVVVAVPDMDVEIALGASVSAVLSVVFTVFAIRAYREEAPA